MSGEITTGYYTLVNLEESVKIGITRVGAHAEYKPIVGLVSGVQPDTDVFFFEKTPQGDYLISLISRQGERPSLWPVVSKPLDNEWLPTGPLTEEVLKANFEEDFWLYGKNTTDPFHLRWNIKPAPKNPSAHIIELISFDGNTLPVWTYVSTDKRVGLVFAFGGRPYDLPMMWKLARVPVPQGFPPLPQDE